jgi:hypothetical protein
LGTTATGGASAIAVASSDGAVFTIARAALPPFLLASDDDDVDDARLGLPFGTEALRAAAGFWERGAPIVCAPEHLLELLRLGDYCEDAALFAAASAAIAAGLRLLPDDAACQAFARRL